ncbi:MAG: Arm DNA-binding domain-containing protein, partial [Alistipes sp.]
MAEYSICKCIRTDKPLKRNGKYPIYLRVRVGFRDTKIPTNLDAFPDQWDKRKNEPRNKALLIQLNKKVLDLDLHINRCLADGQDLTLDLIRDFYSGKRKVKPEFGSFYDYYLDFVERKRK